MQLIKKGATEGVWFTYHVEGAEPGEAPAEFKIRRIPTGLDREVHIRVFGAKQQVKRKDGAIVSDIEPLKSVAYTLDLACYALVDSRNAEVPPEIVPGLEAGENGLVKLDGRWTPEIRRAFFGELPALASWVVTRSNTLTAQAVEEEAAAGKTS